MTINFDTSKETLGIVEKRITSIESRLKKLEDQIKFGELPSVGIEKVFGLNEALSGISQRITELNQLYSQKPGSIRNTGTKVSIDSTGRVVSVSQLSVEDLPDIPISKIKGLDVYIDKSTKSSIPINMNHSQKVSSIPTHRQITISDIPQDIMNRLSHLEEIIPEIQMKVSISDFIREMDKKANKSYNIPGEYSKVKINSDGIITSGEKLSINDLPSIEISNIQNLWSELLSKASKEEVVRLNETVSTLSELCQSILSESVKYKNNLSSEIQDIRNSIDGITRQIQDLKDSLTRYSRNSLE